jgi:hypothetical protein
MDYTVESRLKDILKIYPVKRGSIWIVGEDIWQDANDDYKTVRNKNRFSHYGLATTALDSDFHLPVQVSHGHSKCFCQERWYHLFIEGLRKESPSKSTCFDVWHRFPVPWKNFLQNKIERNLQKGSLSSNEMESLSKIEHAILNKLQNDFSKAVKIFRSNRAWSKWNPNISGGAEK